MHVHAINYNKDELGSPLAIMNMQHAVSQKITLYFGNTAGMAVSTPWIHHACMQECDTMTTIIIISCACNVSRIV